VAFLCIRGMGEIFLHGKWCQMKPGDLAYIPEGNTHKVYNPYHNKHDFVLVMSLTPPQLDIYIPTQGPILYIKEQGRFDEGLIESLKAQIEPLDLSSENEMKPCDRNDQPDIRPWNMTKQEIRTKGALFNAFYGALFTEYGSPLLFVLWPGFGTRNLGFHMGSMPAGQAFRSHIHPISDEVVISFVGGGKAYVGDRWMPIQTLDAVLAPQGVTHGGSTPKDKDDAVQLMGGFASPPQQDLYLNSKYYKDGHYTTPERLNSSCFELLKHVQPSDLSIMAPEQ